MKSKTPTEGVKKANTMEVIRFSSESPFGAHMIQKLKTADDDSRYISAEQFKRKYGHLLEKEDK